MKVSNLKLMTRGSVRVRHNLAVIILQNAAAWMKSGARTISISVIQQADPVHAPLKAYINACLGMGVCTTVVSTPGGGAQTDINLSASAMRASIDACRLFLESHYLTELEPGAYTDDDIRVWDTPRGRRKSDAALRAEPLDVLLKRSKSFVRCDTGGKNERQWVIDKLNQAGLSWSSEPSELISFIIQLCRGVAAGCRKRIFPRLDEAIRRVTQKK